MASTGDFRNGFTFTENGELFSIIEFQHVKPGKGGAFVRTKLRNVKNKAVIDRTFRAGEKVEEVRLERKSYEYLYEDGLFLVFMDNETYDQIQIDADILGDSKKFLIENTTCGILFHGDTPIEVEIPTFVVLEVIETEPGFKGNTASNTLKPATLSTGAVVNVPLFIEVGNVLKIDTRTGGYIERVNK
ncbi:MAG: elongation factor P [Candidatus Latescibacteria bacterium]|nr:elongation factor P [Candidatus Latescibacterota bacterium]